MEITEKVITFNYSNHRGVYSRRFVTPTGYRYGTSEFHKNPTHLIIGFDHDRVATREFDLMLMKDITPLKENYNEVPTL